MLPYLSHLLAKLVSIMLNLSSLSVNSSNYPQFRSQYLVNSSRKILTLLLREENHTDISCSHNTTQTLPDLLPTAILWAALQKSVKVIGKSIPSLIFLFP